MLQGIPSLMVSRGIFAPPFVPTDIAGLQLWLEVDSLSLSDGDPIGTWTDSSGVGNDVSGVGAARPTYQSDGGVNNFPYVSFDGSDDTLTRGSFINGDVTQPFTLITVYVVGLVINAPADVAFGGPFGVDNRLYAGSFLTSAFTGQWIVLTAIANGASSKLFVNSTETNSGDAGTIGLTSINMGLGGGGCAVEELLIYDSGLSDTDRGNVEDYLMSKYGI